MVPPKGTIWTPHLSSGRGRPALSAPSCSALHTALILLLNSRETSQDLASRIDVVRHSFQMSKDFVPLCASNNSIPCKDRRWMKRTVRMLWLSTSPVQQKWVQSSYSQKNIPIQSNLRNKAWISYVIRIAEQRFFKSEFVIIVTHILMHNNYYLHLKALA